MATVPGNLISSAPSLLARKLAKILGEIDAIPKSGRNEHYGYDYVTSNDLINAVRSKLSAEGIFVFTSIKSQEVRELIDDTNPDKGIKKNLLTLITAEHTFIESETGETFVVLSQGQGVDLADKGGYKAITGAMKYFLYKCFMIPTDDDGTQFGVGSPGAGRSAGDSKSSQRRTLAPGATSAPAAPPATEHGGINWREVAIHFGTSYKGVKLGALTPKQLEGWFNWAPNPKYKISSADLLLQQALDAARKERDEA